MESKPVWWLVADMSPEELVACVNFQHITYAIASDEALQILRSRHTTKFERISHLEGRGYLAYSTSVG